MSVSPFKTKTLQSGAEAKSQPHSGFERYGSSMPPATKLLSIETHW